MFIADKSLITMADDASAELKKKRTFRKFTYRGVDLDQLLDMNNEGLMELFTCRIRWLTIIFMRRNCFQFYLLQAQVHQGT